MTNLQMPKNYAHVLIRAQFHLQNALRYGRLQKDETYSYTKRAAFSEKRNFSVYRARSLFAVAKRQRLQG